MFDRITTGMLTNQFLYNLTVDNNQMQQDQEQMTTGKTLNQPSDNPLGVSQDMAINASLSQIASFQSSVNSGLSLTKDTSSTLQSIISAVQSVQQNVLQGNSTSNQSPASLKALSENVDQLAKSINEMLDTKVGDRYLFGGVDTATQPSTYAGYQGNSALEPATGASGPTSAFSLEIATGVTMQVNVTADQLMLQTPPGGAHNLQTTLQNVVGDLAAGNTGNLGADLQDVEANLNNLTNINAETGTWIQRLTVAQNQMNQYAQIITTQKGVIEDANMAQVITQFNTDQTVYQAALKMGAQILLPSLVNYL